MREAGDRALDPAPGVGGPGPERPPAGHPRPRRGDLRRRPPAPRRATIALIAHPPEVLAASNAQHRRLLRAVRAHDEERAAREMAEHVRATEHILAGLLPAGA